MGQCLGVTVKPLSLTSTSELLYERAGNSWRQGGGDDEAEPGVKWGNVWE